MHRLRSRIDALRGLAGVRRPTIYQAPGRWDRFAALEGSFENEVGLRRGNIEARRGIAKLASRDAQQGGQLGLVAPGHGESTAHFSCPLRAVRVSGFSKSFRQGSAGSRPASVQNPVRGPCARSPDALL